MKVEVKNENVETCRIEIRNSMSGLPNKFTSINRLAYSLPPKECPDLSPDDIKIAFEDIYEFQAFAEWIFEIEMQTTELIERTRRNNGSPV